MSARGVSVVMRFVANYGIYFALVGLFLVLTATKPETFFSTQNLLNILRQNSFTTILAVGMTLVILTGGIDLSVGSVVALSGVIAAKVLGAGGGTILAILAATLLGSAVGLVNAGLVTRVRIPPFLASLAMMLIVRGLAFRTTNARTVPINNADMETFGVISNGIFPALIMFGVIFAAWGMLRVTAFGRHAYAVGGNPEAARLAGIGVNRTLLGVYLLCGTAAGFAGAMVASRIGAGDPKSGMFFELDAVAATVVGGTSLFGGRGSVLGTFAGALFIGILNNGLNLYQVNQYEQQILKGLVLLAATSLDLWRGREEG